MVHFLLTAFSGDIGPLNALTYITVRAGMAAVTGFLLCVVFGPAVIRWLRYLKVGQYIREEHVADLHKLHQGKSGTPTMGGVMILAMATISLLLWARLSNRLLVAAWIVFIALGILGFLDDYVKLRRKQNQGLSARGKFAGQIVVGLLLGVYLVEWPITVSATYLTPRCVIDWSAFVARLQAEDGSAGNGPAQLLWKGLDDPTRGAILAMPAEAEPEPKTRDALLTGLNAALIDPETFRDAAWEEGVLSAEAAELLGRDAASLGLLERLRLNRLLMEGAFPDHIAPTAPDLHTKVNIPGFKDLFLALGIFYAVFVMITIIASSNAVNLTDGLDGLAIGTSIVSLLAFTGISYIISRADWSEYLFLTYVPEASELFVFGAALIGTGLGFLWFNCHPAEVFMGDTGSLSLGGAIGTMAILTKQELLLLLVGGVFVLEAASVIIQVVSFKTRKKRVFKMSPLHHHFELLGWSETKVTIRFWILAILFAMMSLGTLKLR